jgi:hypothetical protein
MSQWSSGLPVCFRHKGPGFKSPGGRGYLCQTGILLLALSCYIGDPDMIDHCGLVWGGRCPEPSLGPRTDNVIIQLDLTQLSCPGFTLAAGLPSSFTTDGVGCWRACNLTSFSPCLTGPVDYLFASCHKGPGFSCPGGYLCETGILLLALCCHTIKFTCIVGNPVCMNSEQTGISPSWDQLSFCIDHLRPYHVIGVWVRADPPPTHSGRHGRLFVCTPQNRCQMDMLSIWLVLTHHHNFHWHQLLLHKNPLRVDSFPWVAACPLF